MINYFQMIKTSYPEKPEDQYKYWSFFYIMYTVYIHYSSKIDQFYKGQTSDLTNKLKRHNAGYEKFTKKGVPWKLIWSIEKEDLSQAIILESKFKNLGKVQTIKFMLKYHQGIAGPDELLFIKQLSGC